MSKSKQYVLPSGWNEQSTVSGRKYYVDEATGVTTWQHPMILFI